MTRYLLVNLVFVVPVIILAIVRCHLYQGKGGYILKMTLFLLILTLVFDNIIILLNIVAYNSQHVLGLYVYKAPVEDFMYTLAAILLIVALWQEPDHA